MSTRTRLRTAIASLAVVTTASLLYGLSSWSQRSSDALVHHDEPLFGAGDRWAVDSDDNKANLLAANPITHYFGIPLSGRTIGCIVDGDATMAPYIDNVATITNSVFSSIEKGTRRFGVMQAVERDGRTAVEVAEPSTDLEGARSILTGRLASGRTDLGKALGVASNWYADEVFLVLSKPVDERQMEILTQGAEQTSAVVHVIALGGAAKQDLSPIAKATGGRFVPVTDDEVEKLVERQNDAKAAL